LSLPKSETFGLARVGWAGREFRRFSVGMCPPEAQKTRRMNEVNPRRARFVLGWVTVFGRVYHLGM